MNTDKQAENILVVADLHLTEWQETCLLEILKTQLGFAYQQGKIADRADMTTELTIPEITDQIYDTLSGNGGMSKHHVIFNPDRVTMGECDASNGIIVLQLDEKKVVKVLVSEHTSDYFSQE